MVYSKLYVFLHIFLNKYLCKINNIFKTTNTMKEKIFIRVVEQQKGYSVFVAGQKVTECPSIHDAARYCKEVHEYDLLIRDIVTY